MKKLIKKFDKISNKYGFVDENGKIVVPFVYNNTSSWSEGLIFVDRGRWKGFLDENADEVLSLDDYFTEHSENIMFKNGLCQVSKYVSSRLCYGYIDKHGEEVIPVIYNRCEMVVADAFLVAEQSTVQVKFLDGKIVPLDQYVKVGAVLSNGLIAVCMNCKYGQVLWGCIDCFGKMKVPALYDEILSSDGDDKINVVKNGDIGFVDKNGEFYLVKPKPVSVPKDGFDKFMEKFDEVGGIFYVIRNILGF